MHFASCWLTRPAQYGLHAYQQNAPLTPPSLTHASLRMHPLLPAGGAPSWAAPMHGMQRALTRPTTPTALLLRALTTTLASECSPAALCYWQGREGDIPHHALGLAQRTPASNSSPHTPHPCLLRRAPMLITTCRPGRGCKQLLVLGQKAGIVWAVRPDSGTVD